MPTKPTIVNNDVKNMNSANIINTVRSEQGDTYQDDIPKVYKQGDVMPNGSKATGADAIASLRGVGEALSANPTHKNAFLSALANRIAMVIITSRLYENPWSAFKKGLLEYGESVEEIFVNLANPQQFDPEVAETNVFKRTIPDVRAAFHTMNYQKFYPVTVSEPELRQAFLSWNGINDLISKIITTLYTGANNDEFLVMKYLIAKMALTGKIYSTNVPVPTEEDARALTRVMTTQAKNLSYMNNKFNQNAVYTYTDPSKLYTILSSEVSSLFDIEVLALSFNMNKAELIGRQIGVDSFSNLDDARLAIIFKDDPFTTYVPFTTAEKAELAKIVGLMVDESWFMIFDNYYNMTEQYNGQGLYWNYFYHVWKTFSVSPFSNAVLFTSDTPGITSVTVTPATATVTKGQSLQLSATVVTTGMASQSVVWAITTTGAKSTINGAGLLTVPSTETETSLTITATSVVDGTKHGTATITVA